MEKTYNFIAIFDYADDGISIEFPDLPGCYPSADTTEEAIQNAKEAMGLHLWSMEKDGNEIPTPSKLNDIKLENNQVPYLVEVFMPSVRLKLDKSFVKKTLSVPAWLNAEAEQHQVNFSKILQDALLAHLELNSRP